MNAFAFVQLAAALLALANKLVPEVIRVVQEVTGASPTETHQVAAFLRKQATDLHAHADAILAPPS